MQKRISIKVLYYVLKKYSRKQNIICTVNNNSIIEISVILTKIVFITFPTLFPLFLTVSQSQIDHFVGKCTLQLVEKLIF